MKNKNLNYGLLTDTHVLTPEIKQNFNEHFEVKDASFARGRFANVRRCLHKSSLAECAAKVMRKYRRAVDVTSEIMHEVRVLMMADKERNIVNLLQVYETTSEFILVLEMAAGGELQRVLDEYDCIPEANTKIMLRQLMNAVIFLHNKNIAHLDIKPQNILLTAPYPIGEVKLCDFGISRLITNDTELREIIGTADYVAPEILHYEPIFLTTDMWSVGVLAYVMLSGFLPYTGETKQETFLNITSGALDFPDDLFKGISEPAIDFICKLLKKKPKQRLSSIESLEHEWLLSEVLNDQTEQMQQTSSKELEQLSSSTDNQSINLSNSPANQSINQSVNQSINQESVNNNLCKINVDTKTLKPNLDSVQNGQILNDKNALNTSADFANKSLNENCTDKPKLNELENNENELNKTNGDKLSLDLKNNSNQEIITTISSNEQMINICSNVTLLTAN